MTSVYQCDKDNNQDFVPLYKSPMSVTYKCANTRKCYWLCPGCLKGHDRCSGKCPDYLSVAKVKRLSGKTKRTKKSIP